MPNNLPTGKLRMASDPADFLVNSNTIDDQFAPTIAALADGGWVVTWTLDNQDGSSFGVYGQRYDSSGVPSGSAFRINTYTTLDQSRPSVAGLDDGGWVVAWISNGQDGSSSGIYSQRYNSAGLTVGGEFRVNTSTSGGQSQPSVTGLADGGWLVTWSGAGTGDSTGIYGQRYDDAGSMVGGQFRVNTYTAEVQGSCSATGLVDGGWVVMWQSNAQDGSSYGVYGQRFDSAGSAVEGEFRVNTFTTNFQGAPSVTALVDGGWVVTWNSDGQDGSGFGVYGQRYSSAGALVGGEFRVNTTTGGAQANPSATALDDGGWVVTYSSDILDIYGQRYNSAGSPVGAEFRVTIGTDYYNTTSEVAALPDGGWVVTWRHESEGEDGPSFGTYGQRFAADGTREVEATGTDFRQGTILFADASQISDVDGINAISWQWQWQRSADNGATWVNIAGATNNNYKLSASDNGQIVRLKGTYSDSGGTLETVYSDPSSIIINIIDGTDEPDVINGTTGIDAIYGGKGSDWLNGSAGNDLLEGGSAHDRLDGGTGADIMRGGNGNDNYYVDNLGDVVEEAANAGTELVNATVNWTLGDNFENLTLRGTATVGTGNALPNEISASSAAGAVTLYGLGGHDYLRGSIYNDTLDGGEGNDQFFGDSGNDTLLGGAGRDSLVGGAGNDILDGGDDDDTAVGGDGDDRIYGGAGRDILNGTYGNDELHGGTDTDFLYGYFDNDKLFGDDGNDFLFGGTGADELHGGNNNDKLKGEDGADTIYGDAGIDQLYGGNHDDVLWGGAGQDYATGDGGADRFMFDEPDMAGTSSGTADRIRDFTRADGDLIDLSAIDAIEGGGDDAFTFIGNGAFSNTAGELRFQQFAGYTMVQMDTDGDGATDYAVRLEGLFTMVQSDFVL